MTLPAGLQPGGRFEAWERQPVRFVASDVDGTILRADDTVSPRVRQAVLDTVARGTPVGFCTGRMRNGALHIHRDMAVPGPHVFHNGAEVRANGITIASWPLSPEAVTAVLNISETTDAYCELYTEEGFFISRYRPGVEAHWVSLDREPDGEATPQLLDQPILKATFIGFDDDETDRIEQAALLAGLQIGSAGGAGIAGTFVNVTMPGVHKGRAVAAAADHIGVEPSGLMAIGDGNNDVPMLEIAGTAVAMAQASETVKAAAHVITGTIAADGAAAVIETLVLGSFFG